jgi:hypothetical protein
MSRYSQRILNGLRREFTAERDEESFEALELARWALGTGKVTREPGYADKLIEKQLASEFAEAMREDYTTDLQGRTVREMYAARVAGACVGRVGFRGTRRLP